jgi:hypothetical protein
MSSQSFDDLLITRQEKSAGAIGRPGVRVQRKNYF